MNRVRLLGRDDANVYGPLSVGYPDRRGVGLFGSSGAA